VSTSEYETQYGTHFGTQYETWRIDFPRTRSRAEIRQVLTEHAEYGKWELWRVRRFLDGRSRVWLRRRLIRVRR
jgi:hypothetical protein